MGFRSRPIHMGGVPIWVCFFDAIYSRYMPGTSGGYCTCGNWTFVIMIELPQDAQSPFYATVPSLPFSSSPGRPLLLLPTHLLAVSSGLLWH